MDSGLGRRGILLLMIGVNESGSVDDSYLGGITRLQKLLFLLENEQHIRPEKDDFQFEPYLKGPYSSRVYDDLELLENLGLVVSEQISESTRAEAAETDVTFEDLFGDPAKYEGVERTETSDVYQQRNFKLTQKGYERIQELLSSGKHGPVIDSIRKVKSRFARLALSDLLYYVYSKYPEMTTESDIKDKVMRGKY